MSREPSDATRLRNCRADLHRTTQERDRFRVEALQYRERATKAEQEVAAWKVRFDALLKITAPTGDSQQ